MITPIRGLITQMEIQIYNRCNPCLTGRQVVSFRFEELRTPYSIEEICVISI